MQLTLFYLPDNGSYLFILRERLFAKRLKLRQQLFKWVGGGQRVILLSLQRQLPNLLEYQLQFLYFMPKW